MNRKPKLVGSYLIHLNQNSSLSDSLYHPYGGAISQECLELLHDEWKERRKRPLNVKIFTGFDDRHNVYHFSMGFVSKPKRLNFQQVKIVELLSLAGQDRSLGLSGKVCCLGGSLNTAEDWEIAFGTAKEDPHFPYLGSIRGHRLLEMKPIDRVWNRDLQVALIEVSDV